MWCCLLSSVVERTDCCRRQLHSIKLYAHQGRLKDWFLGLCLCVTVRCCVWEYFPASLMLGYLGKDAKLPACFQQHCTSRSSSPDCSDRTACAAQSISAFSREEQEEISSQAELNWKKLFFHSSLKLMGLLVQVIALRRKNWFRNMFLRSTSSPLCMMSTSQLRGVPLNTTGWENWS